MTANGPYVRRSSASLNRRIVAAATGGIALVLPLLGAGFASAAPAQAAEKSSATASAAGSVSAPKGASVTHSVIAGESLSKIAQDFAVEGGWQKLYDGNRDVIGGDPALIRPGMQLVVGEGADAKGAAGAPAAPAAAVKAAPVAYTNNLDGWIREALAVLAEHGIPGSYDGIHRNVMRESAGNPRAINNWDSNAVAGTPSKGLLQVIDPTFRTYHVPGTAFDPYDPVANITAACNYAAARYGSIDNVNSAY